MRFVPVPFTQEPQRAEKGEGIDKISVYGFTLSMTVPMDSDVLATADSE